MADGVTIAGVGLTTAGITLFGVSTGLDPAILIAGFAGGVWAQSYYPPTHWAKRVVLTTMSAILAGYFAPFLAIVASSYDFLHNVLPAETLKLPTGVIVGLLAHRVLGPALMRLASIRIGNATK